MTRTLWWGIVAIIIVGLFAAYIQNTRVQNTEEANTPSSTSTSIANPASTNCVNIGGTLEIVTEANGQAGYCHLKDGRVCEEWSLFRDGSCIAPKQ